MSLEDNSSPNGGDYRVWQQLSDLKAGLSAVTSTLKSIQEENSANRERFHRLNDSLQTIVLQLDPIYRAMPSVQAKIQSFDDLKNKGIGVILAASAVGAIIVEVARYAWSVIHPNGNTP